MHPRFSNLVLTTAALLALSAAPVAGGPLGGTVVGGSATIQGQGGPGVTVNQSSNSAIINWNTFNIGVNESVRFNQPSSSSVVLNRVTGGLGPSEIMGTLTANGRVFVINRDGILFGPSAVVNTAGFLATTNDIRNRDFMAGRYNFNIPGRPDASIVNQGRITATSGGFAALVAPGVRNSGTITATLGTVALASGNSFTLDLYGDKLITLAVSDHIASKVVDVATGQPLKSLVSNEGKIRANGGRVELTAAAARVVVDSVINTSGVIKANSIGQHNGMIVLSAATGASNPAGAATQSIKISGTLSAAGRKKGTQGGTILVSGEDIKVANARIDASGRRGGGKVLIGGDWGGGNPNTSLVSNPSAKLETYVIPTATTVSVDAATTINASATGRGNGGKVVLWSDSETTFAGTILARGGAKGGDGGFVETSSHGQLAFTGSVDSSAPRGRAGTLLLDPQDFFILSNCDGPCQSNQTTATIIQNQLANQNVVIATNNSPQLTGNGDIFVNAGINWATNNSLTLNAYRNINIAANVTIANTAAGNLVLRADSTGTGVGTVTFGPGTSPGQVNFSQSTGTVSIFYDPTAQTVGSKYQNPTNFLCSTSLCGGVFVSQPSQLTAYMLVNNASDLQLVSTAPGGTYALGRDVDASSIANFVPIPNFTGLFDGQNLSIANLQIASTAQNSGLFGAIGSGGAVRNLNLANVNVTGTGSLAFVGAVAGQNSGTISNVHVLSGTVNGGSQTGVAAGGLVAQNKGLIENSTSAANVSVGDSNSAVAFNAAGGLVGINLGTITGSSATGNVTGGVAGLIGGLVGENGLFNSGPGSITSSFASGNVSSTGVNASLGGLAGFNAPGSIIAASQATGTVSSTASVVQTGPNCAASNSCQNVSAGGLVGGNFGTITQSSSSGSISVGSNGTGGGLVGFNAGIIASASATGNVTGAAGSTGINGQGGSTTLGGLVGNNQGLISDSSASGNVGNANVANLQAGGLVGDNSGTIVSSNAGGNVQAGSASMAGGLVGSNSPSNNFNCPGCMNADGSPYFNTAVITGARASGNVGVGAGSLAGGFAGASDGVIAQGSATGAVTGGGNSILGGFIGALGFGSGSGAVSSSTSSGAVTSTGPNSVVGGFVGVNGGVIAASSTSSPVTGTSESYLGGFAGLNLGAVTSSTASGSVTGTGTHDVIGGFVGANFGSIDSSSASGNATGGSNSAVGGFAGANARFINFSAGSIPGSSFPVGTITNSTATGAASGGPGSTVDPFIALNDPNSASNLPAFPSIIAGCSDPLCGFINTGILPLPPTPVTPVTPSIVSQLVTISPEFLASLPGQAQVDANLVGIDPTQLAALKTAPVVDIPQSGGVALPPQPAAQPPATPQPGAQAPGPPNLPPGLSNRIIDIPSITQTDLVNDEAVVQIATSITLERLRDAVAPLGLTVIASENLGITQSTVVRLRITNGRTVRDVIRALASVQLVAVAQPNYIYRLHQQGESAPASRGDTGPKGDAAQYVLEKLKIADVHRLVRGNNVLIAVIDSEIDAAHPDLEGVIAQSYDAVGAPEKPHSHGTGMAGAIASHQRLLGTAPGARLLAVHAFSTAANAESTTFNILKGVDWSVRQGARIINMSFAGPKDPSLARALQAAYDRGIVLIAAAGNAGPKSPPLYPGADPNVIAVTATDAADKLFTGANRGTYISVSAPGVDILVPAPEGDYQITTGTSVAAAEVSGIVALLLERNPKLTPADIRRILTLSAKRLSPGARDNDFGSGLIDPLQALQLADPRTATTTPPAPKPATRQR
jgi:filamentous hemagglutinin family protein